MSTSRHPIALRLERLGGSDAKLLALVMGLPLIDGIFPALILAGALDDPIGALQVGLLIFGGSATVAVVLAEMSGTPREQSTIVLLVGVPLILVAALQAALAPAIGSVLDLVIFERFAALVIAAIAAKTASATVGEYLPSPGVIVALGLLASIDPAGADIVFLDDPTLVVHATGAAVVGVLFALSLAVFGPHLREHVDIDRFRFGCALALGLLPLSILGMLPVGHAPLAVLAVAALFAFDPHDDASPVEEPASPQATDGGERSTGEETTEPPAVAEDSLADDEDGDYETYPGDDTTDTAGRAPWL
ncbi:DUF5794 domain-containing protein [Halovivax sp.]|uniref:DUF5794 domain-containing protein n=1 Tax=Halovivax sp. TaxID=1935978 RepID=UPI0025B9CB1F|nr:DUF5794 domain-containing protein [Halovivax sp.]